MAQAAELIPSSPLALVATGDQSAVSACIDRYSGLVWSLARRFLRDRAEAEDAVQEIFIEVWKHASRFDPSIASDTTFVAMIARRRLIDRVRRRQREPEHSTLIENADRDASASEGHGVGDDRAGVNIDDLRHAREALSELSDDQQRVLRLSLANGLSHEQISSATDLPLGTVKTHLRRGLIKLRSTLAASPGTGAGGGNTSTGGSQTLAGIDGPAGAGAGRERRA